MASVPASEIQKNFGEWHDRAFQEPVEITKYGRTSAFLVSATLFKAMWASYRRTLPAESLTEAEIEMIVRSKVESEQPYTLDDLPDHDNKPVG
ncbi:type II toxin-antitoxin system Phd/YefM family antitoxin [Rhizobium sp. SL86]|uniref:type II toxin-antitoxin system Phd/YefM family antitoxin n=1 Tax=Rhizobium sp. SL86 TaxID=2995148 RepID=UPI002275DDF7|nr:type II toxin-antitoxin system Phd/YefM family antitoxin [Rhizobium sp. SL86]MCY1668545.1 type II toxin-antitoxin system Phd/YefM family antitoxin [Rhizobium sp. SL86]